MSAQALAASSAVSASKPPAPAAGSATFARLASSIRISCVLRAMRRAKASGRPIAWVNGRTVIASAPPIPAATGGDRAAQNIGPGITRAHHAPGGFGVDAHRRRGEAAGLLDARPQQPQRPEFGDAQEYLGIRRQAERNHRARRRERDAGLFERPQIGEGRRQSEGEFLGFRSACGMHGAPVGDEKRPPQPLRRKFIHEHRRHRGEHRPVERRASPRGHDAEGIEAAADGKGLRIGPPRERECREICRSVPGFRTEIDLDRHPVLDRNRVEQRGDGPTVGAGEAETIGAERAAEDEMEAARAIGEFGESELIGDLRIGVIDPRQHLPGTRASAQEWRRLCRRAVIKRPDRDPVGALVHESLEALALRGLWRRVSATAPRSRSGRRHLYGWRNFARRSLQSRVL